MAEELTERYSGLKVSLLDTSYIFYKVFLPDLKDAIKDYASGDVLDVGCGNKPYKDLFPSNVTNYVGCDIEQSSLKLVDKICPATDLDFESNSFDTVFCTQVLEHVFNHKKAIHEINRVLRPNGIFIGSVPMAWPHHEEPYDFFRFTKYGLQELLKEAGFNLTYIKANGGKWALLGQMIVINISEKPTDGSILSRFRKIFFKAIFFKVWVNLLFSFFDKISSYPKEHNTLNLVFVAQKNN